jgi:hypothetical protein
MQLSNHIKEAMDINEFLNPADEEVNDSLLDLDEMILSQYPLINMMRRKMMILQSLSRRFHLQMPWKASISYASMRSSKLMQIRLL